MYYNYRIYIYIKIDCSSHIPRSSHRCPWNHHLRNIQIDFPPRNISPSTSLHDWRRCTRWARRHDNIDTPFKRNDRSTASRGGHNGGVWNNAGNKKDCALRILKHEEHTNPSILAFVSKNSLSCWGHVFSGDKSLITIDRTVFWRQNAAGSRSRCAATSLVPGWSPKIACEWMVIPLNNMIILYNTGTSNDNIIITGFDPSPYLQSIRNTMNFNVPWEYHGNSTADHESLTLGCFNYAVPIFRKCPNFWAGQDCLPRRPSQNDEEMVA